MADELLPPAKVGMAGGCLSLCNAFPGHHLHSAMLVTFFPGVGIVQPQAIPVLKKCHSLCRKELLTSTDD